MTDFPRIPASGEIEVPNMPRPPIASGAASVELGRAADELGDQVAALGAHFQRLRQTSEFNLAEADYVNQAGDVIAGPQGVLRDPQFMNNPDKAHDETVKRLSAIQQQILAKYPNANPNGILANNLAVRSASHAQTVRLQALGNLEKDTSDQVDAVGAAALTTALNPQTDPKDGAVAINNYMQTLDNAQKQGLKTPGYVHLAKQQFSTKLAVGRFQQLAQSNPEAILRMTEPPAGVPPEALAQGQRLAMDQLEAGQRAIEADLTQHQAAAEKEIESDALKGLPIGAKLETFAAHFSAAPGGRENSTRRIRGIRTARRATPTCSRHSTTGLWMERLRGPQC